MKRLFTTATMLFLAAAAFAQAGKLKLSNGQKIQVESSTNIQASFGMGMELTSNSTAINSLQVKNATDKNYTVSNTLTKLKVDMNMMGQANSYDSENKSGNSSDMAKIFDERLNKTNDVDIDNNSGQPLGQKKITRKKGDDEGGNPAEDLLKMFSNTSDDAIVSGAFEIIPAGRSVGDKWSDSTVEKDMKTVRTYTLKSMNGNEAVIQVDVVTKAVNMVNFQEMEFEVKTNAVTTGEIITDPATGIVKKRTNSSDISGSLQMMGQDMPISAKSTSTTTYR